MNKTKIFLVIPLTLILWFIIFIWQPFSFWLLMCIGIFCLVSYALIVSGDGVLPKKITRDDLIWGILSAIVLYLLFLIAFFIGKRLFPESQDKIQNIYILTKDLNQIYLILLLLFVIGPGEEIFWRGFMQKGLNNFYNPLSSYILTGVIYTLVHAITGNLALTAAAGLAGFFWGALYYYKPNLTMLIISHTIWDILILIILPIK